MMMETIKVQAVIGTNSWGGKAYGKAVRGSYVADSVIKEAMREAADQGLLVYDLARDDGLGKAQYAVISGDAPYDARPENERNAIAWTAFDPAATSLPSLR